MILDVIVSVCAFSLGNPLECNIRVRRNYVAESVIQCELDAQAAADRLVDRMLINEPTLIVGSVQAKCMDGVEANNFINTLPSTMNRNGVAYDLSFY
jgi:hypothetical protein